MRQVMSTKFLDGDGCEWSLKAMNDGDLKRFHYLSNRRHYDTSTYCISCHRPSHIIQTRHGLYMAHDPGHGRGACEYADFIQSSKPGMSIEHMETAAAIAIAIRDLRHWNAEAEKKLPYEDGYVQPDVYAWHDLPKHDHHQPTICEVQLSRQGLHETQRRTEQRRQADPSAQTIWWTPNTATVSGPLLGVIINDDCTHVAARAFSEIEPERVPMRPTVTETARRLRSDRNRWTLINWRDDDTDEPYMALMPQAVGSNAPARPDRNTVRHNTDSDELVETGCNRTPVAAPTPSTLTYEHPELDKRKPSTTITAITDDLLSFVCPRCGTPAGERFYGPCSRCRTGLRMVMT